MESWLNQYSWLETKLFGVSLSSWLISLGVFILVFLILYLITFFLFERIKTFSRDRGYLTESMDLIYSARRKIFFVLMCGVGLLFLNQLGVDPKSFKYIRTVWLTISIFFAVTIGMTLFRLVLQYHVERRKRDDSSTSNILLRFYPLVNVSIWMLAILFWLDNIGVNISTLVAGLGISGIAVAFALQSVLADLFSYFYILFDKPFETGDLIVIDDLIGNIQKIGVKTTKMKSITGEQVVIPNSDLVQSKLKNLKRLVERRELTILGVEYSTPIEKLHLIKERVGNIIEEMDDVRLDRIHLKEFGDSAITFEIAYYVLSSDFNDYMDAKERVNFCIIDFFEKNGINFAFPSQTIYFKNSTEERI